MTGEPDIDDISEPKPQAEASLLNRRNLVIGGGLTAAGLAMAGAAYALRPKELPRTADGKRKIKVAWNANALCIAPVLVAQEDGIFAQNGLEVELVNFAGSTDQLLEAISTGKADAGIGMILRWIKPLEQNFDVKLVVGTHGGCLRVVGSRRLGITEDVASLRGKVIGMSDAASTGRSALAILLKYHGVDPDKDVDWRVFNSPLLKAAVDKGEVHAFVDSDPLVYLMQQSDDDLVEVLTNLSPPWHDRFCCVLGVSGNLLRHDQASVLGLSNSLMAASSLCASNPERIARAFLPYAKTSEDVLVAILRKMAYHHTPIGDDLIQQVALYATELRNVGVMKPDINPAAFAAGIVANPNV